MKRRALALAGVLFIGLPLLAADPAHHSAEHIVTAAASMFQKIREARTAPANPAWEEKTKGKTR